MTGSMLRRRRLSLWPSVLVVPFGTALLMGCSQMGDRAEGNSVAPDFGPGATPTGNSPSQAAPGGGTPGPSVIDGDGNPVDAVPDLDDEEEVQVQFELPSAGERYVYAANPDSNSVAVIDSETLAIQSVEAGDTPTFLQSLGGRDAAIVLNVRSDDATIIRTSDGVSRTSTVDVVSGSNAIAVGPDGRHAVVYFNVDLRSSGPSGSFQDLSVILLDADGEDRSVGMTVGFRPSAVHFSEDGSRAFVVTEDGVSVLDFDAIREEGSHIARTVPLGDATQAEALDVSVTPDGKYALARPAGEGMLRLADLEDPDATLRTLDLTQIFRRARLPAAQAGGDAGADTQSDTNGETTTEVLGIDAGGDAGADGGTTGQSATQDAASDNSTSTGNDATQDTAEPAPDDDELEFTEITDVDLAPTGQFAIAVFRDRRTILKLPVPEAFDDLDAVSVITVGNEIVGSVDIAPNGERALLYTTALETNERLTILDLNDETLEVVRLPKSVKAVTISPDSESALVVHQKLEGDPNEVGIDPDALIDRSYGYSVVRLDDGFSKLQLTPSALGASTIVPDATNLFILFNSPSQSISEVHRVGLESFLVQPIALGSPPISIGAVPGSSKVFVGQEHPDGRITFIDWETAETESVTGFELNSRIRE